jgi:phospho-N-acetylmuramoyl-pentapeptide-transferase
MHYITFRGLLAMLLSAGISFLFGPWVIKKLRKWQKFGQPIRDEGPETHAKKVGTPTMGGLMIIGATLFSTLLLADLRSVYVWTVILVMCAYGFLGFLDDYLKVTMQNTTGVRGKVKLVFQFVVAFLACWIVQTQSPEAYSTSLAIPFLKNTLIDLGFFYIPFVSFVVVGASNAVNLTDGLDGLAIVPIAICAGSFALISYLVGNSFYANYLQVIYVPDISEVVVLCSALIGSSLGFLWYNSQPAEIFMGDTGSLSMGGTLGIISVLTKHEIVLAIIGGVFVMETLSVILQVYYFKYTGGRRIFKMAPLHHHFEKGGWSESKVVIRFWIMAVIFSIIGLSSLKLR